MIINPLQNLSVMLKTGLETNMKEVPQNHTILTQLTFRLEARLKLVVTGHILGLTVTKKPQDHQELQGHLELQGHHEVQDPRKVQGHHKVQGQHKGQGHMTGQGQKGAIQIMAGARYGICHAF